MIAGGSTTPRPTLGSPPRSPVPPPSPVERCRGRPHARPSPLELRRDGKKPGPTGQPAPAPHRRTRRGPPACPRPGRPPPASQHATRNHSNSPAHTRPSPPARQILPGHLTPPSYAGGSTAAQCAVFDPRSPMHTLWGYNSGGTGQHEARAAWRRPRSQLRTGLATGGAAALACVPAAVIAVAHGASESATASGRSALVDSSTTWPDAEAVRIDSIMSSTWNASSPEARCGVPAAIAAAMSARP